MKNLKNDLELFHKYAHRFHSRGLVEQDLYSASQSVIENKAHRLIAKAPVDRTRILEIGGGGGEHIAFEKITHPANYVVIEKEQDFLDIIKKKFNVTTIRADGTNIPFADDTFTTCIASSVLEHVVQLEQMLREVSRVLKNNGDLLITVPTNGSLVIEMYKLCISYPFMYFNGIKKPSYIWHYENVNCFKRINALLRAFFTVESMRTIPFSFMPSCLSPMHFYHCKNRK